MEIEFNFFFKFNIKKINEYVCTAEEYNKVMVSGRLEDV